MRIAAVILLGAVSVLAYATPQRDLFNNLSNSENAMSVHETAWRQQWPGNVITRTQMQAALNSQNGNCITEESAWRRVDLSRSLNAQLDRVQEVACYIDRDGRAPADVLKSWRWTVIVKPLADDRLQVIEFRRSQRGDIANATTIFKSF